MENIGAHHGRSQVGSSSVRFALSAALDQLVYSKYTPDQLDWEVPSNEKNRCDFEDLYGKPTDIDEVWAEREAEYNRKYPK